MSMKLEGAVNYAGGTDSNDGHDSWCYGNQNIVPTRFELAFTDVRVEDVVALTHSRQATSGFIDNSPKKLPKTLSAWCTASGSCIGQASGAHHRAACAMHRSGYEGKP